MKYHGGAEYEGSFHRKSGGRFPGPGGGVPGLHGVQPPLDGAALRPPAHGERCPDRGARRYIEIF